ncbi:MAG TPA: GAF domain-containing protein, partial [Anaerolineales bacterium]|nr:GAF domain-containing protein [Anaerolineales bacterium]
MFKLQRYFSVASLVAILVVAALLALLYRQIATNQLINQAEKQNIALTRLISRTLWPEFSEFLVAEQDLSHEELQAHPEIARFREEILAQFSDLSVVKIKAYNLDGVTVFSTQLDQIGEDKSQNAGFLAAKVGDVESELTFRDTFSAFEGVIENRSVISSYVPIFPAGEGGPAEGVFEVYADVTPLVAEIDAIQRDVVLAVVALLAALYGVLFLIVRRADRTIMQQHSQRVTAEAALTQANELLETRVEERTLELKELSEKLQVELREREIREAEREALLESEKGQREVSEVLGRVGAALSATLDISDLLNLIARESSALYKVDSAFVWLLEGEDLVGLAGFGPGSDEFIGLRIPARDSITVGARVILEQQPIFINDAPSSTEVNQVLIERFHIQSLLGVPLVKGDKALGSLILIDAQNPQRFGPGDIEMAAILGSQAAIAVENALLFDESVRRATELSSLLEAAQVASSTIDLEEMVRLIARQMVNVLGVDGCVLSRWDRSANAVVTWVEWLDNNTDYPDEPGTSYSLDEYESTRRVLENSEPVVVQANDPEAEPTEVTWMRKQGILSSLMLPLGSGDKAIGLVELIETKVERDFTPGEIQLCQAMASQAAMTIENARLFEGTRLQLQRLAALREIDTAITASMDRHLTLNILLEQVVNTLQVDAAEILLLSSHSQMLKAACQRGHPGLRLSRSEFRLGEGLAGQAALERRTLAFPDLRRPAGAEAEQLLRSGCGAYFAVPLVAKAQVKGVLEVFHRSPLSPDPDWLAFLETLAGQAAIAIDNAALFDDLQRSNTELTLAYDTTLEGW